MKLFDVLVVVDPVLDIPDVMELCQSRQTRPWIVSQTVEECAVGKHTEEHARHVSAVPYCSSACRAIQTERAQVVECDEDDGRRDQYC